MPNSLLYAFAATFSKKGSRHPKVEIFLKSQLQSAAHNIKLLALLLPIFLFTTSSTSYPFEGKPVFTLKDITYSSQIIYSTPTHLAVADGHIEFNLTNSAVPYTTHCSGSSQWLYNFFYGNIVYICNARTGEGMAKGASANFTFSNPAGTFTQNANWTIGQLYSTTIVNCKLADLIIIPIVILVQ
ncbi:hypothetical protein V2W45_1522251 [Cenococcum geophilum]